MRRTLSRLFVVTCALVLAACGSVAAPIWEATEAPAQEAAVFPTRVPPSATPLPATATPIPTQTPLPTATFTASPQPPTATPTLAPTSTPAGASDGAAAGSGAGLPAGFSELISDADPALGQTVFNATHNMPDGSVWMCSQCHSVTPDEQRLIGPGLWNIADRAETRIAGQDGLTYIYNSIAHPHDFLAPGDPPYPPLMPLGYDQVLTEEEFASVVAYLLTLQE